MNHVQRAKQFRTALLMDAVLAILDARHSRECPWMPGTTPGSFFVALERAAHARRALATACRGVSP